MTKGKFVSDREIADLFLRSDQIMCDYGAWHFLLSTAAFKDHDINYKGRIIKIKRGQIPTSYRNLADTLKWSVNRVIRFLRNMKVKGWIDTHTEAGFTIITIREYCKIQNFHEAVNTQKDTGTETQPDTKANTDTDTRTDTNRTKETKETQVNIDTNDSNFEKFWKAYPRRKGSNPKKPAQDKFARIVKNGVNPQELIRSAEIYAHEMRSEQTINTKYVVQAQKWLSEERWKDQSDTTFQNTKEEPWSPF